MLESFEFVFGAVERAVAVVAGCFDAICSGGGSSVRFDVVLPGVVTVIAAEVAFGAFVVVFVTGVQSSTVQALCRVLSCPVLVVRVLVVGLEAVHVVVRLTACWAVVCEWVMRVFGAVCGSGGVAGTHRASLCIYYILLLLKLSVCGVVNRQPAHAHRLFPSVLTLDLQSDARLGSRHALYRIHR